MNARATHYRVNGRKIWTSNAHRADYMIALLRTSPPTRGKPPPWPDPVSGARWTHPASRSAPSQAMPGMTDFNEVLFEDVMIPADHMLGEIDGAWKQATAELAYERSGPERFLETFYVLTALTRVNWDRDPGRCAAPRGSAAWSRTAAYTAPHVGLGRRHAARGSRNRCWKAPSSRTSGTVWEQDAARRRRARLWAPSPGRSPTNGNQADFEDLLDFAALVGPEVHHPGRHDRDPAWHHRPRTRACAEVS